jgi:hypothetical protein
MKRREFFKSTAVTQAVTAVILIGTTAVLGRGQTPKESDLRNFTALAGQTPDESELRSLSAFTDGVDAYIYGYPLVMVGLTERVATTVPGAVPGSGRAPINQLVKETKLPNGSYKDVVLPSTSTLYTALFSTSRRNP